MSQIQAKNKFLRHLVLGAIIAFSAGLLMAIVSFVVPKVERDLFDIFLFGTTIFLLAVVPYFIRKK